jgi:hypothetical protein
MPDVVLGLNPAVFPVPSGVATSFLVHYQSTQAGTVELRCSASFSVSPASAALPAASTGSTVPIKLTVTRTNAAGPIACDLVATFFQSRVHSLFEVH